MNAYDRIFPRYTEFDPLAPIWCVTPNRPKCLHRFFDTSPFSPSGKYLAVFEVPFEDRQPKPGETGKVCVIDLETGKDRVVAETAGWEHQMGANLNWGGSDNELFFNDVDTDASPNGRWLVSANMATMRKTQPGYGVCIPDEQVPTHTGPVENDGFYLTNTASGECRLLVSFRDLLSRADPPVHVEQPEKQEIYGFHSKFNPQGDALMLSLRWFPASGQPQWNMFKVNRSAIRFAWVTMPLDVAVVHCAAGPEQWEKGGHHATWFPDGRRISMNLKIDRDVMRFVQVNADGSGLRKMSALLQGSGHPTVHPDGRHLLTDAYTHEPLAFGDGTTPLRWVDLATEREVTLARIPTATPWQDKILRVDPHPAWDRTWRYIAFNAFVEGTRRVFIADMKDLL